MIVETMTFSEMGGFHGRTVKVECPYAYAESIADGRTVAVIDDGMFGRCIKVGDGQDASYTMVELVEGK